MNTMIKIALFDENRYFSAGWQEALALHFSTYGKRTLLVDARQVHEADLVFCYFPPGVQSCFCHLSEAQPAGSPSAAAPSARWPPLRWNTNKRLQGQKTQ
ncbi:hypothetical protein [Serratia bockelmannii]|uniref:hypothetical protein n=1 Tax=Serratia bockelmannii TaxID=2703793 RepID=UPI003CEBED1C